jgi:hypothetical protein
MPLGKIGAGRHAAGRGPAGPICLWRGVSHALMGSVAEKVVQMAPCPVLSIKHPEHEFIMP